MKESNHVRKILMAAAVIVIGVPAIASATPHVNLLGDDVAKVSYSDLDLTIEAGLVTLYKRLQRASDAVCGARSLGRAGSLRQLRRNQECYSDVLSNSVAKFDSTRLDRIHAE
jgi:UrcA family protein